MINKFKFFDQVVRESNYYNVNAYTGKPEPYEQSVAWKMYEHAYNPATKFLLFGRTNIDRQYPHPGAAIEPWQLQAFGATNDDFGTRGDPLSVYKGGGSVLRYQLIGRNSRWHVLYNHAWLLGGIHGRVEFVSASPRTKTMIFNPDGKVSMWGHELLFLRFFGYRPRKIFGQEIWAPYGATPEKTLSDFLNYFNNICWRRYAVWAAVGDFTL
jgi:hypothetical protein